MKTALRTPQSFEASEMPALRAPAGFVRPTMSSESHHSLPASQQPHDAALPGLPELVIAARTLSAVQFLSRFTGHYLLVRTAATPAPAEARSAFTEHRGINVTTARGTGVTAVQSVRKRPGSNPYMTRITVGRAANNDIVLTHPSVSKLHAWFEMNAASSTMQLVDASSRNGTAVQGTVIGPAPVPLRGARAIRFGLVEVDFVDALGLRTCLLEIY